MLKPHSMKPRRNTHQHGYSPARPADHATPFAASSSRVRALTGLSATRRDPPPRRSQRRHCRITSSPRSPPTASAHTNRGASVSGAAWHCAISSSSVLIATSHQRAWHNAHASASNADLGLAATHERAASEHQLTFRRATAALACKLMDRTTWIDRDVVAWLQQHALAIQIDVDAQKDVAKQLRIEAMPTIIAFVDGIELDRVVGARSSSKELLVWLDGVMRGKPRSSRSRRCS